MRIFSKISSVVLSNIAIEELINYFLENITLAFINLREKCHTRF